MSWIDLPDEAEQNAPITVEQLLISLGATRRFIGFRYIVYIVNLILTKTSEEMYLTKYLYPSAAKHFNVSSESIERAIRVVAESIWENGDRGKLDKLAAKNLTRRPSNGEFINMLVSFLIYQ